VEGRPEDLIERLAGRLWRKLVEPTEVAALRTELPIVSTRMVAGRTEIRVVADSQPADDLEPVTPSLEDVYFSTLLKHGLDVELD